MRVTAFLRARRKMIGSKKGKPAPAREAAPTLRVLSLGAGVQSSALALMAEEGDAPMPDCAIFADVGAEPREVYDYLEYLESVLSFPVYRVMKGEGLTRGLEKSVSNGERVANPPLYTRMDETRNVGGDVIKVGESEGMLRRQCTDEFKIKPITKKTRELLGLKPGERVKKGTKVESMQGISLDEIQRMRESKQDWLSFRYPLVEMRMSRHDCKRWIEENQHPQPPRSACVYCPYRSNHEWRNLRENDPEGWAEAVRVDAMIRDGMGGTTQKLFVHQSLKPLNEVDLRTDEDFGQMTFLGECDGMCGV